MNKKCSKSRCNKPHHAKGLCSAHYKKARYKENPNINKEYEKTEFGFIMRMYNNMKFRVAGVDKNKRHLYAGKPLLPKEEFYDWAKNHPSFKRLFIDYKLSNYARRKAPSVDRLNPDLGYTIDNMEWVTQSENSRRASITRKRYEKK